MRILLTICLAILFLGCNKDNDDSPPPVNNTKVSVGNLTIQEGETDKNIFLQIQLSESASKQITVRISSSNGTASAGEDYEAFENVPIVFQVGDQVKDHQITIKGDEEAESNETFNVNIVEVEGAAIQNGTATVTIQNDDGSTVEIVIPSSGATSPLTYPGMSLIWQDEFDGPEVNESNWTFEIGNGNSGWGNNELQYYRKENTVIYENHLVIEAMAESFGGKNYTSSRMITKNKFDFQYGRVDIRANLPYGQGIWPALWMLGSNISTAGWPACGEIDIMEIVGHQASTLYGTAHWSNAGEYASFGGNTNLSSGIFNDEFHVFSIIWDENQIRWLLDDVQYHALSITPAELSEFKQDFFFIFNVAVGGNWPGSPDAGTNFPQRMIVDYIRVFQ